MSKTKEAILYVDDEIANLEGFEFTFMPFFKVFIADCPAKGLQILAKENIKLVISDQRMPEKTGAEFLQEVSEKHPFVTRIILTAYADMDAIINTINIADGVYRYLFKPWDFNDLKNTITNGIERYNLRIENLVLIENLKNQNKLLESEIKERKLIEKELHEYKDNLELKLDERTKEILAMNEELNSANEELNVINEQMLDEIKKRSTAENELKNFQTKLENIIHERTKDLVQSQSRINMAVDIANIGFWEIDQSQDLFYSSQGILDILGYNINEIEFSRDLWDKHVLPEDLARNQKHWNNFLNGRNSSFESEYRIIDKKKKLKWVISRAKCISKQNKHFSGIIMDVTPQKLAEEALKKSEEQYRILLENMSDAVYVHNDNLEYILVNQAAVEATGIPREKIIGSTLKDIYPDIENMRGFQLTLDVLETGIPGSCIEEVKLPNGDSYWYDIRIYPVPFGTMSIVKDITAQKNNERKILSTILETEERERKKFAEDLHDELGPFLSSIKLYISQLKYDDYTKEQKQEMIEMLKQMVDDAVSKTRLISNLLMPNILMDYGIVKALKSFAKKLHIAKIIQIDIIDKSIDERFAQNIEIVIYRILIEQINNTIKHAKAENIKIIISQADKKLNLSYEDDGIGFNFEEKKQENFGLGIQNIINRIETLGGKYSYKTPKTGGSKFEFSIGL